MFQHKDRIVHASPEENHLKKKEYFSRHSFEIVEAEQFSALIPEIVEFFKNLYQENGINDFSFAIPEIVFLKPLLPDNPRRKIYPEGSTDSAGFISIRLGTNLSPAESIYQTASVMSHEIAHFLARRAEYHPEHDKSWRSTSRIAGFLSHNRRHDHTRGQVLEEGMAEWMAEQFIQYLFKQGMKDNVGLSLDESKLDEVYQNQKLYSVPENYRLAYQIVEILININPELKSLLLRTRLNTALKRQFLEELESTLSHSKELSRELFSTQFEDTQELKKLISKLKIHVT
jgi:hypothetical protein